jgi:glyceraldehyde 3-phosphate dehydrogenase
MKKASVNGKLSKYLGYEEQELVSIDFRGDSRSSIVDAPMTRVVNGNCVKVIPGTTTSGVIPAAFAT